MGEVHQDCDAHTSAMGVVIALFVVFGAVNLVLLGVLSPNSPGGVVSLISLVGDVFGILIVTPIFYSCWRRQRTEYHTRSR